MIDLLLSCMAALLLIPVLVVFLQVIAACIPKRNAFTQHSAADFLYFPRIAVLIPAHNESAGIVATLESIRPQLRPSDRLLVVADNCTDDTATIAMTHGAEVLMRQDSTRRGKGYALAYGVEHLSINPPDVVVIIDADCTLRENSLAALAIFCLKAERPVQSLNLMYSRTSNLKMQIAEFAWCVKNWVRPLGYARLRFPCQLMGTGMAFPWSLMQGANLANSSIVEDMKLGIELAILKKYPVFFTDAQVSSYFPEATETQSGQRARWEHGHLSMILSEAPQLLLQGLLKLDKNLFAMAFDLLVPPLALLVTLIFCYAMLLAVLLLALNIGYFALQLTLAGVLILIVAIGVAWWGWGRNIISLSSLMMVPIYVISKIPHYFKFLFNRQKTWNKTERD